MLWKPVPQADGGGPNFFFRVPKLVWFVATYTLCVLI